MSEDRKQENSGEGAIQIKGDHVTVMQIGKLLTSLTESTLQANFYAATGIRCGKKVRIQLEFLMEEHGFNYYELARAWNTHSIVDDRKTGRLRVTSRAFDLTMGWGGVAISTVMLMAFLIGIMGGDLTHRSPYTNVIAIGLISGFLGVVFVFAYTFLHPQKVAKRVANALNAPPGN